MLSDPEAISGQLLHDGEMFGGPDVWNILASGHGAVGQIMNLKME